MARRLALEAAPAKRREDGDGEEHRRALRRVQAKQEAVADLIAGRVGLLEAAARFQAAGGGGCADGEVVCRAVIGWAQLALSERPERAEALAAALEDQLLAHLTRHGDVRLPLG
jgi:hypothetical protein